MLITLGKNISSLKAQRALGEGTSALSQVYERLSSGLRINRASDDPAALALASNLQVDARIRAQGVRNVNDALSVLAIREAALHSLSEITSRITELATQAANGTFSSHQRGALDDEAQALIAEYRRVVETTEYNDSRLLDGSTTSLSVHGGSGISWDLALSDMSLNTASEAYAGTGLFTASSIATASSAYGITTADVNGDGFSDIIHTTFGQNIFVRLGTGSGTFKTGVSYVATSAANTYGVVARDFTGDGVLDLAVAIDSASGQARVLVGNGNGTFKAFSGAYLAGMSGAEFIEAADVNNDGRQDLIIGGSTDSTISVLLGNVGGSFALGVTFNIGSTTGGNVVTGDFNGDSFLDLALAGAGSDSGLIMLGNGNGTFRAVGTVYSGGATGRPAVGDINGDSYLDIIYPHNSANSSSIHLGNGNGTFKYQSNASGSTDVTNGLLIDINRDGKLDYVASTDSQNGIVAYLGNGNGTFKARISTTGTMPTRTLASSDFNGDGVPDVVTGTIGTTGLNVFLAQTVLSASGQEVNLLTQSSAREAIDSMATIQQSILSELALVGSQTSRLDVGVRLLSAQRNEYEAARSRIIDLDVAEESARLVALQISQQARTAILSQANQQPLMALKLL